MPFEATFMTERFTPGRRDRKEIMIVAGEASGDLHGSTLVKALLDLDPALRIYGIGGQKMEQVGVELLARSSDMAVVGLTEVFHKLRFILKAFFKLKRILKKARPDLVILIDYPDFNFPLARSAKKVGIPVFYYISPQVWAWRKNRIKTLRKITDRMAVILPFEAEMYAKEGLQVNFVGHPLLDVARRNYPPEEALRLLHLKADAPVIGLLPGSRENEVKKLLPEMLQAALILRKKRPDLQFILPLADTLDPALVNGIMAHYPVKVEIVRENIYDVMSLAEAVMVASGTATLETALMETPMVIVYKVSALTYWVGRMIIDVPNIGLVNLIAGKTIVPELIQQDASAEKIAEEIEAILSDKKRSDGIKRELARVREKLGTPGVSRRTAKLAYELIQMT